MHIEESISKPKSYVLSFSLDQRQLQSLYVAGLIRESCPLHARLSVQSEGRYSQVLSVPPAPPQLAILMHVCLPSSSTSIWSLVIGGPWLRPFSGTFAMTTVWGGLEDSFLRSDSIFSTFPLLALCLLSSSHKSHKTAGAFCSGLPWQILPSALIHLTFLWHHSMGEREHWGNWCFFQVNLFLTHRRKWLKEWRLLSSWLIALTDHLHTWQLSFLGLSSWHILLTKRSPSEKTRYILYNSNLITLWKRQN